MTKSMPSVRLRFHVATGRAGHKELREGVSNKKVPLGRIPRVSRLMALAIRFEQLIRDGVVRDQAELARLAFISRARVTQIMDLLLLAPEIQEELLFSPPIELGHDPIHERRIREIVSQPDWKLQRQHWHRIASCRQA